MVAFNLLALVATLLAPSILVGAVPTPASGLNTRQASTFWMSSIKRIPNSFQASSPSYQVFRDVTKFGAIG